MMENKDTKLSDETLDIIKANLRDYAEFEYNFNKDRYSATAGPITELDAKCALCEMIANDCQERNHKFVARALRDNVQNRLIAWSFLWRFHFYRDRKYLEENVFTRKRETGEEISEETEVRPEP